MKLADFSLDLVRQVVDDLGSSFFSNDVANSPPMLQIHDPSPEQQSTYRKLVGKYLSVNRHELHLRLTDETKHGHGHRWIREMV